MSELRKEIVKQVEKELEEMLATAPENVSESTRKEIKEECIAYAQRVVDACSKAELASEVALDRFLQSTIAHARLQMHMR
jgi:hypothetical protein